ncbi:hypothetical protein [Jiangella gansuensis]|uniref:hypothetical protein n=1 Tax=Jiangella gansuensis TaxID=281473 RepID=UPI00047BC101|nr:hypothetical protein [Jiangella gansuensis]
MAAQLNATATRLAFAGATPPDAASELRAVAGGRFDLIAQEAGKMAGIWSVKARYDGGAALIGAGFLVMALGADSGEDLDLVHWVDEGRFAAERSIREAESLARFHEHRRGLAEGRGDFG